MNFFATKVVHVFLAIAAPVVASPFTWVTDGQNSLELRHDGSEVLARFLLNPEPADPHFDILKMCGGVNLVWVGPNDHPWHYGHWFSWKYINKVNFWETDRKTGQSPGRTEVSEPTIQIVGSSAEITYKRFYRPKIEQAPVLKDEFTVTIHEPVSAQSSTGPTINWSVKTTALVDVVLDRTPIPGEPNGKNWGGYAGLSWRGTKALTNVEFTDSKGRRDMEIHRERSQWVNAVGTIGEQAAGLAIIAPADKSGVKPSWYIFAKEDLPFWFINPAILQPGPITLEEGSSFIHEYRVVVHDGSWSPKEL
ncbi:MAG: DUF6807 family protein [Opitutales bacterium]